MAIHLTIRQCIDMVRLAKVLLGLYSQDLTGASSLQCSSNAFARMSSATTISVLRCACRSVIASAGPEDLARARDDLYHARHVLLYASINRPHRTRWLAERSILYAEVHVAIEHIRGADSKGRSSENYTKNHNKKIHTVLRQSYWSASCSKAVFDFAISLTQVTHSAFTGLDGFKHATGIARFTLI